MRITAYSVLFFFSVLLFYQCKKEESIKDNNTEEYILNIKTVDSIQVDEYVPSVIELVGKSSNNIGSFDGRIKRRGGFSIGFPKHSFEIDFDEDVAMAGLPKDDDWILNANYIDKTFLRHVLSYELFREMGAANDAAHSVYLDVQLNGEYNGFYVLMEKLDKSSLDIASNDIEAVIFKEPHIFRENYNNLPADPNNFHQQTYPDILTSDKTQYIESARTFILEHPDSTFEQKIKQLFDFDNILDWHILLLISNNSDGILKNFYLYKKDKNTPLRVAPWDYDHSFGRDGDNELNLDTRPMDINRSVLFRRLLGCEWYKTALKARWEKHNADGLLSAEGLKTRIQTMSEAVAGKTAANFDLWPVDAWWYYDANSFEAEIDIMLQFIDLRHERLQEYFDDF